MVLYLAALCALNGTGEVRPHANPARQVFTTTLKTPPVIKHTVLCATKGKTLPILTLRCHSYTIHFIQTSYIEKLCSLESVGSAVTPFGR